MAVASSRWRPARASDGIVSKVCVCLCHMWAQRATELDAAAFRADSREWSNAFVGLSGGWYGYYQLLWTFRLLGFPGEMLSEPIDACRSLLGNILELTTTQNCIYESENTSCCLPASYLCVPLELSE